MEVSDRLKMVDLKMVIKLEICESLRSNYKQYQQIPTNCTFPSEIKMFPWNDVSEITEFIYEQTKIPVENQRLFFRGEEITAYNKYNKYNKLSSPTLSRLRITHESQIYLQCAIASYNLSIVSYGYCISNIENKSLVSKCISGLLNDLSPILSLDGEGGTYFLRDINNNKIACFKPLDEEAGCINNPRGRIDSQQGMHSGIKPGEGHLREIAAYLLDNNNKGFHCVPPTIRIECLYNGFHYNNHNNSNSSDNNKKIGALQKFIHGEVIENFGVKNFSIFQVHKIGILDVRILNCDRNSGNVLVSRDEFSRYELIPIDHGLSLPEKIEITRDSWVWLNWNQSKQPFDPYTIEYINNININKDIQKLSSQLNFNPITFENMRISHLVLVKCTNMGLTLHQIGNIIARPDFDTKSILEELMIQAEILSIEKVRQNKHLIKRIKLQKKINSSHTPRPPTHDHNHIFHKFIEKGKTLKPPTIFNVPSLAPVNARLHNNNNNNNNNNSSPNSKNNKYQILNKNIKSNNINNINNRIGGLAGLSPIPSILNVSASTGNNINNNQMSLTPEPKFIIVEKKKSNDPYFTWTPTMKPTMKPCSLISNKSSNTNGLIRSVTPEAERKQTNLKNKRKYVDNKQIPTFCLEKEDKKNDNHNHNHNHNHNDNDDVPSSLPLINMEKTSSIHDRDQNSISNNNNNNNNNNNSNINTIFGSFGSISKTNKDKPKPFSSLDIDSFINNNQKTKLNNNTTDKKTSTDLVPLSRSTSCIDIRKASTFSLNSLDLNNNKKHDSDNIDHHKLQLNRLSKDEDSFYLYNNDEIKSASLINETTMLRTRKEFLAINSDDSNNNNNNYNDSPSINNNNNNNNTPSYASHKSQDDNINIVSKGNVEFGIHPIMERMAKENYQVKKWFWYYLDQLLGIQCERIIKFSRKNDNSDDIYDIDTVHGSFIWKNELRKHWVRSRLERKKLMQPLPPTNPFEHIQYIKNINTKPILIDNKTSPTINTKTTINGHNITNTNNIKNIKNTNNINTMNNINNINIQPTKIKAQEIVRESSNFLDLEHLEDDEDDNDDWFGGENNVDYDYDDDESQ